MIWGHNAEFLSKFAKKGSKVTIEGKITNRSYEKDGQTKYITEIVANSVDLHSKSETSTSNEKEDEGLPEWLR